MGANSAFIFVIKIQFLWGFWQRIGIMMYVYFKFLIPWVIKLNSIMKP